MLVGNRVYRHSGKRTDPNAGLASESSEASDL